MDERFLSGIDITDQPTYSFTLKLHKRNTRNGCNISSTACDEFSGVCMKNGDKKP